VGNSHVPEQDESMSPKDLSDIFALLVVVLVVVSTTLTVLASREGRDSGLWSAIGAVGSVSQALFVGIAVLVAVREVRSHFQLADRVRLEVVTDQVLAVAFREVAPGIRILQSTGFQLSKLTSRALEQEMGREFAIAPEPDDLLETEFQRIRVEFLRVAEELRHACTLLETYCSLSPSDHGWHHVASNLSAVCSTVTEPPRLLGMCTSKDPERIVNEVTRVADCWASLAATVKEVLTQRPKPSGAR
jgi:hypothetical protein